MNIEYIDSNNRMSKAVKHNQTIYLCGQTSASDEWDIKEQTLQCLQKVENILAKSGSSSTNILSVTIYISDMSHFSEMNQVWDTWFNGKPKPARACVEAKMAHPNILVELSIIAALDNCC